MIFFVDDPYNSTNARLIRDLLRRYSKHVRPVLHPADSITVSIYGAPYQIINVVSKLFVANSRAQFKRGQRDPFSFIVFQQREGGLFLMANSAAFISSPLLLLAAKEKTH